MRNKIKLFFLALFFLGPRAAVAATIPVVDSPVDPVPGLDLASETIEYIIEILLLIVGLIAVLFLIVGGYRYITAHGNEEQSEAAKKTITHSIIGIVIVILAFVIIRVIVNALVLGNV